MFTPFTNTNLIIIAAGTDTVIGRIRKIKIETDVDTMVYKATLTRMDHPSDNIIKDEWVITGISMERNNFKLTVLRLAGSIPENVA